MLITIAIINYLLISNLILIISFVLLLASFTSQILSLNSVNLNFTHLIIL